MYVKSKKYLSKLSNSKRKKKYLRALIRGLGAVD
jgi:hypothetical protein